MSCLSSWSPGSSQLGYRILMSGTSQVQDGWCTGIYSNIKGQCGASAIVIQGACEKSNPDTIAYALDGDNNWNSVNLYGIDMTFAVTWPWVASDADHACIATAVRLATCSTVEIANGPACRSDQFSGSLMEYDTTLGPA